MAEILALLGGGAAATQLIHYSCLLVSSTSALSHRIRHASDRIQSWNNQSSSMLSVLEELREGNINLGTTTSRMAQQCRGDLIMVRSLLRPFRFRSRARRPSRRQEIFFVLRNEVEVERRLASSRQTFNTMALSSLM
jgi:ribosomal 50S subunit-associated protein YjgA (DUF615 family)